MKVLDRGIRQSSVVGAGIFVGILAALYGSPAGAQENLYSNKTPAQIFASDCAICHKSPQGLSKAGGMFGLGLESFLREHYTASRESAAAIAKYIQAMDSGPAAPEKGTKRARSGNRPAAKKDDAKASDGKPVEKKAEPVGETKTEVKTEAKPDAKPEAKPEVEAKPAEKPPEAKPAEAAKPEKSD